ADLHGRIRCSVRAVDRFARATLFVAVGDHLWRWSWHWRMPSCLNCLSGRIYPPHVRSTGAGWALGLGRVGAIVGPLLGGVLLGLGFPAKDIFVAAAIPVFAVTVLMAILGRLRRSE